MEPMFLNEEVEAKPAEGPFEELFDRMTAAGRPIPQIWHLFNFKPDRTHFLADFTQGVMRGPSPLSPGTRELIAAFTSSENQCPFWIGSHAAGAAALLGDAAMVRAVLADYRTAPITDAEKELFGFLEKVNKDSPRIARGDVEAVKRAGWSEEAIYDAVSVCALFNFYNRWIDATGVHDMPASAYELTGQRLAERGYTAFGSSSEDGRHTAPYDDPNPHGGTPPAADSP